MKKNSTELNQMKQKREGIGAMQSVFDGYWNIKGCARMVGDLSGNFCAVSGICGGALSAIAPQMRPHKKGRTNHMRKHRIERNLAFQVRNSGQKCAPPQKSVASGPNRHSCLRLVSTNL